jgi:inner membrane protein
MDMIASFFAAMTPWHWFGIGLVLLMAELATGTTYLLWPAVAAWITALFLLAVPMALPVQLLAFGVATLGLTVAGRRYLKGRWLKGGDKELNDRGRMLIGASGVAAGTFEHGVGRVKLGDSEWRAESKDSIGAGDAVSVLAFEGATLKVVRRAS